MKKFSKLFIVSLVLLIVLFCGFSLIDNLRALANNSAQAQSYENFARIKFAGVYLYKTPTLNESYINMHFEIPDTYFVKLLGDANEYFYRVEYLNQIGYVKKLEVQPISGVPLKPYASATFRVFSSDGTHLKDSPFYAANTVATLPQNQNILQYIGRLSGEEAIIGRGNLWYYCKFGNTFGYVYGGLCDMLTEIVPNTEVFNSISNPFITPSLSYIEYLQNSSIKYLIIAGVISPALVVFFMLFIKITPKGDTKHPHRLKRIKSIKPQYLYDDSEL